MFEDFLFGVRAVLLATPNRPNHPVTHMEVDSSQGKKDSNNILNPGPGHL